MIDYSKAKHIKYVPYFRGLCLPPFGIFLSEKYKNNRGLFVHELIHWKQYKRMGLIMFYFRYLSQLFLVGYDIMPMEMEARQHESEKFRWNYRQQYFKPNGKKKNS